MSVTGVFALTFTLFDAASSNPLVTVESATITIVEVPDAESLIGDKYIVYVDISILKFDGAR